MLVCLFLLAGCSEDTRGEPSLGRTEPRLTEPTGQAGSVKIASDAFGFYADGTGSYETVRLSGTFDTELAVAALHRAGERFMLVDEEGTEYADLDSLEAAALPRGLYSPNYVADPRPVDGGIDLYVDCKGVIEPPMAVTFRRILREELERSEIRGAVTNAPL